MRENLLGQETISGITLVELLAVISVLGILAAISVPAFFNWLPDYRLRTAARDLYSNFQTAKLEAIRTNTTWAVVFDESASPGKYFICSEKGANNSWDGPPEMGGDDVKKKQVNFSTYKGNIDFGYGNAFKNIPGKFFSGKEDNISFTKGVALFGPRGLSRKLGYVYLSNKKGTSYGIGSPTIAGVIVLKKLNGTEKWE